MEGERIAKSLLIYRTKYRSVLQQGKRQAANGDALSPAEPAAATLTGPAAGTEAATAVNQRKRSSELIRRVH